MRALAAVICFSAVPAAAEKVGDIEAAVQPLPNRDSSTAAASYGGQSGTTHGYIELRVQLKNSSNKEQIVHLTYPGGRYGISHGVVAARTVRVTGGQEVSVSLYQPPVEVAEQMLEVRVEGVRDSAMIPVTSLFGWQRYMFGNTPQQDRAAVLLSRSVPQDFRDRGQAKVKPPPATPPTTPATPAAPAPATARSTGGRSLPVSPQRASRQPMESQLARLFLLRRDPGD